MGVAHALVKQQLERVRACFRNSLIREWVMSIPFVNTFSSRHAVFRRYLRERGTTKTLVEATYEPSLHRKCFETTSIVAHTQESKRASCIVLYPIANLWDPKIDTTPPQLATTERHDKDGTATAGGVVGGTGGDGGSSRTGTPSLYGQKPRRPHGGQVQRGDFGRAITTMLAMPPGRARVLHAQKGDGRSGMQRARHLLHIVWPDKR